MSKNSELFISEGEISIYIFNYVFLKYIVTRTGTCKTCTCTQLLKFKCINILTLNDL